MSTREAPWKDLSSWLKHTLKMLVRISTRVIYKDKWAKHSYHAEQYHLTMLTNVIEA